MEQHLDDLDQTLLERNAMTIIRVYLNGEDDQVKRRTLHTGRGELVRVALPLSRGVKWENAVEDGEPGGARAFLRDRVICNPVVWKLAGRRLVLQRRIPRRGSEPVCAGAVVRELLSEFKVQLGMMHFPGGADTDEIIRELLARGIPYAVQNHYSNDRFRHLSIRKHTETAAGVAGISDLGVPPFVKRRFVNLSNGIDTRIFQRSGAGNHPGNQPPLILHPARIVRSKGQLDTVRAAGKLARRGLSFRLAFAGRTDSEAFDAELRGLVRQLGLAQQTEFLGVLDRDRLRAAYETASLVSFPTHHHEGLGRVVVEAEAMKVPPVAYDIGGVAEGMIPDQTGLLVALGDVESLASGLERLLRDETVRTQMGEAGRRFVEERFSLPALAARHEAFYLRLLAQPVGSAPSSPLAPGAQS